MRKGQVAWNKGKKMPEGFGEKISKIMKGNTYSLGYKHTDEAKRRIGLASIGRNIAKGFGENASNWKGDNVGYHGLHKWVQAKLGKPMKCEHCGDTEKGNYQWANKSHEYKRDLSDWLRLCASCHHKYDYTSHVRQHDELGRFKSN